MKCSNYGRGHSQSPHLRILSFSRNRAFFVSFCPCVFLCCSQSRQISGSPHARNSPKIPPRVTGRPPRQAVVGKSVSPRSPPHRVRSPFVPSVPPTNEKKAVVKPAFNQNKGKKHKSLLFCKLALPLMQACSAYPSRKNEKELATNSARQKFQIGPGLVLSCPATPVPLESYIFVFRLLPAPNRSKPNKTKQNKPILILSPP